MKILTRPLFLLCFFFNSVLAEEKKPSTVITSDQMEMQRQAEFNVFYFAGQVRIKSKDFYGECEYLKVFVLVNLPKITYVPIPPFEFIKHAGYLYSPKSIHEFLLNYTNLVKFEKVVSTNTEARNVDHSAPATKQIQQIIARKQVFLETKDERTGETKRAKSDKAIIYPNEGKMVLTENPSVYSSQQGTFSGEVITFFKNSERIIVENKTPQKRAQVFLSEEGANL